MSKATTKRERAERTEKLQHARKIAESTGLIKVSFCFDGRELVQSHQFSTAEVELQKQYLESDGLDAFTTVTLRMAIWGAGKLGEHAVIEAFKEYARKNYKGPVQSKLQQVQIIDDLQEDTRDESTERNYSDSDGSNAPIDDGNGKSGECPAYKRPGNAETSSGESPTSDNLS